MLEGLINKLKKIRDELPKEAENIAIKQKDRILDYIRDKQLFNEGIDGKGNKLKAYKPFTIAIKRQEGKPYDRVTLNDTGSFYNKMDLLFTDQYSIGVFSRDEKTPDLIQKYGADIFTFTAKNIKEIDKEIFETNLVKWLIKQINSIKI